MDNDLSRLGHKFHFRRFAVPGVDSYTCEVIEQNLRNGLLTAGKRIKLNLRRSSLTLVAGGTTLQPAMISLCR